MFEPAHFREDRVEVMHGLMRTHPFAMLVSTQDGRVNADHLPLVLHEDLSENGTLRGHIAKGNPLWLKRDGVGEVLAVFQGPQAYITASWYPSKNNMARLFQPGITRSSTHAASWSFLKTGTG